jgi:hypothetical protein
MTRTCTMAMYVVVEELRRSLTRFTTTPMWSKSLDANRNGKFIEPVSGAIVKDFDFRRPAVLLQPEIVLSRIWRGPIFLASAVMSVL